MKYVRDIVTTLLTAIIIFVALQVTLGSFKVYGLCMLPNIEHGDYIMVNKATYFFHEPERGDVIVFHSPKNPESDLIKRVIALPGDTIRIKQGEVFINSKLVREPYINEPPSYQLPLQKIPDDYYFVLGDNRNNSADSHTGWLMHRDNIIGKAWINYWPLEELEIIHHYSPTLLNQ